MSRIEKINLVDNVVTHFGTQRKRVDNLDTSSNRSLSQYKNADDITAITQSENEVRVADITKKNPVIEIDLTRAFARRNPTTSYDVIDVDDDSTDVDDVKITEVVRFKTDTDEHNDRLDNLPQTDEGELQYNSDAFSSLSTIPSISSKRKRVDESLSMDPMFGTHVADFVDLSTKPHEEDTPVAKRVEQVLEIFPDADIAYVRKTLDDNKNDVERTVSWMIQNSNYPKSKESKKPLVLGTRNEGLTLPSTVYDFMSMASFQPSDVYKEEVAQQLVNEFLFLSIRGVKDLLFDYQYHYAICHDKILTILKKTKHPRVNTENWTPEKIQEREYFLVTEALYRSKLDPYQIQSLNSLVDYAKTKLVMKSRRRAYKEPPSPNDISSTISDPILKEEVKYVQAKLKEWLKEVSTKIDRDKRKAEAEKGGTSFVCACCYDSYHWDDIVSCTNPSVAAHPHLFCADCVQSIVRNLVFDQGNLGYDKTTKDLVLELQCFHGDGCSYGFHIKDLSSVLPPKLLDKYEEVQMQVSIKKAGLLPTVHACPKCNFKCEIPPNQNIFSCPMESCLFESCRLCGRESHIPLRCDEYKNDVLETNGRTSVEEAITAAKVRNCPSCHQSFIKSDGCNKIRCGCGAFICYVCRKQIKDYTHFCQKPHCTHAGPETCSGCPLYTKAEEDDVRLMREAGLQAAKQQPQNVQIDVEKILKDPFKG